MEINPNSVVIKKCVNCNEDKELIHFYSQGNNNRLNMTQILQHYDKLISYNDENNITMPQEIIDLFSNITKLRETSLEPSLPLTYGNICEELG